MKLFRQKDELFEVMNKAADRRRVVGEGAATGAATSGSGERPAGGPGLPRKTVTTHKLPRPDGNATVATGASSASSASGASTTTGPASRVAPARPRGSVGAAALGGGRVGGVPSGSSGSTAFSSPFVGGPVSGPPGELVEVDGDALVVLDDGWDEGPEPGRLLALRLDTAVVGGLLVVGLLATAFLVGRTSSPPTPEAVAIGRRTDGEAPVSAAPLEPSMSPERRSTPLPARASAGSTTVDAGAQADRATSRGGGFRPGSTAPVAAEAAAGQPASEAAPTAPQRKARPGKFEMRVVTTTEAKATEVARWLNGDAGSPIIGRNDLEAIARGGSVRIVGFAEREGDLMTRVRATTDPTNRGSGTFNDAYFVAVQAPGR